MDGRPTWTDCDEAVDYVVPNVLSPRDLVFRPDKLDETVPHIQVIAVLHVYNKILGIRLAGHPAKKYKSLILVKF